MALQLIERLVPLDDFEIKRSATGRTVTAYAASFGEEAEVRDAHGHYWEGIHRSAFNKTISHGIDRVHVFYNHGYDLSGKPNGVLAVPFATPLEIKPDGKGLLTISRYNDGDLADAVLAAWQGGQIKGQSFRGGVHASRDRGKRGTVPRIERMELSLKEYGPTHSPVYTGAGLVAIRSQQELEDLIRSMISAVVPAGTPGASPAEDAVTPSGTDGAGDSPAPAVHSSRNRARMNLLRARALELGVIKDGTTT
jgi:HK97 family phage prohead protease